MAAAVIDQLAPDQAGIEGFLADTIGEAIHLVAIAEDGDVTARWFGKDAAPAARWAASHNAAGRNLYWTVNAVRPGLQKKPTKAEIAAARFAHVDIDPPKDGSVWRPADILAQLHAAETPPSFIIWSGNGLQPIWRLDEPCRPELVEPINQGLCATFGGDHCWNVDRLLRLPFTVNHPYGKKARDGRVPAMASLAEPDDGVTYRTDLLAVSFPAPEKRRDKGEHLSAALPENIRLLTADDLDLDPFDPIRSLIEHPRGVDRSADAFACAGEMLREGFTIDQIAGVLLNPANAVYAHFRDRRDPRRDVLRTIANAGKGEQRGGRAIGKTRAPKNEEPSEDDIALAFTAKYRDTLRYDRHRGDWFEWDISRWRPESSHRAFTYARQMAREGRAPGRASFAGGVEKYARNAVEHNVGSDLWDADPFLLGTPGGTVDLRTGDYFEARPHDYITRLTSCAPDHGTPELWLRFLGEALNHDEQAIRFLQLWCGYCLTGDTREHALLFLHGLAGTGKSVFLNTIKAIMGDYAVTAAMETFTAAKFDRHSTEVAMLAGARVVTASETEEGRQWAEARIKSLTGGDPITARFMRQDNFEFRPQFKLLFAGNHAPRLVNPDDAMRRRFNILGFNVKPAEPDLQLEEKLKAEHPQILAWAITGCKEWQRTGLARPASVAQATADYFAGEDLIGQWLEDHCQTGASYFELPAKLYADWKLYAEANGEAPGTANGFGKKLGKRGFYSKVSNGIRAYRGLRIRPELGAYNVD